MLVVQMKSEEKKASNRLCTDSLRQAEPGQPQQKEKPGAGTSAED